MALSERQKILTRERVRRYRARQKVKSVDVTDADIARLPLSIQFRLRGETRARQILRLPDNLRDRQELAVRAFRGY